MAKPSVKKFKKQLKHGVSEFVYKKKSNGKIRHAKGTLDMHIIPKEDQPKPGATPKRKPPEDSVVYYDTQKKALRSFKDYLLMRVKKQRKEKKEALKKDVAAADDSSKNVEQSHDSEPNA